MLDRPLADRSTLGSQGSRALGGAGRTLEAFMAALSSYLLDAMKAGCAIILSDAYVIRREGAIDQIYTD